MSKRYAYVATENGRTIDVMAVGFDRVMGCSGSRTNLDRCVDYETVPLTPEIERMARARGVDVPERREGLGEG